MGRNDSTSSTNSVERSNNLKLKLKKPIKASKAPKKPIIYHDYQHPDYLFACQLCPKRFSTIQALGGHQNAHKREKCMFIEYLEEHVDENDINGKKKLCCTVPRNLRHLDNKYHHVIQSQDHHHLHATINPPNTPCHIIHAPKPLRAFRRTHTQVVTRPTHQGYQPISYGIILSPKQTTITINEQYLGWVPNVPPPPPLPPPPPPFSAYLWTPFNFHRQVRFLGLQVAHMTTPMLTIQQPQAQPFFPSGFGDHLIHGTISPNYYDASRVIKNVGVEQLNAWNLDLSLRL